jgi:hypothetical protein
MSKRTLVKANGLSGQQGLFDTGVIEGGLDIALGFRQCLSRSIHRSGKDRYLIAAEISQACKRDMTKDMLDKYTSSDPAYGMRAEVLTAFCHSVGTLEPFRYLLEALGADVINPEDRKFLHLARLEDERRRLDGEIQNLRAQCGIK